MVILEIAFYIFIAVVGIQVFFYGIIFNSLTRHKVIKPKQKNISVSVIICAKNEAENLKKNLPLIMTQDYSDFEVILINDDSTDDTLKVLEEFQEKHNNIKIVNVKSVEKFWGNKKYALTLGIKAATHNFLLFTDADCKPLSTYWIKEMTSHFSNDKTIVLGYGAHKKIKGSFINKLIRYETFLTAIQYLSYAALGQPYMAVGRNLAYRKEQFFETNGFMQHMHIKSGDDDLFINQVAKASNTTICITKESFTESIPKQSLKDWTIQKRRHITTANHYKLKHQFFLATFYCSQLLFWILAITLLIVMFNWKIVVGLIILRFLVQFINLFLASKKLNEKDLPLLSPLLELFLIVFQFFIFIKNMISKPKYWK
ncbi:glycosyltransferase [Psychroserpens ponticola]|uniref:Glycosyltransferase n=1 Tax=Psychroserpens ponticola TaxID=2932268 RepID=A0ABY7S2U2_9FLAO|nr:glycosyltransferase [Psychroserpens ponticola]WCO02235.1 glycosyltransferase [Psychroserpens ponticola]